MSVNFELANSDCVAWLRSIESESVDLVVTDPAYQSLERHRATGTTTRLTTDWFDIFKNIRFVDLLTELYRVLKKDTHCYIYCDQETSDVIHHTLFDFNPNVADPFRHTNDAREHYPFAFKKRLDSVLDEARELGRLREAAPPRLPARFDSARRHALQLIFGTSDSRSTGVTIRIVVAEVLCR